MCVPTCECVRVHLTVCVHTCMYVHVRAHVCMCVHMCAYLDAHVCMYVCMHVLHQKMSVPSSCFMHGCTSSTLLLHPGEWMNEPTSKQHKQLLNKLKTTYRKHSAAWKHQEGYAFGIFQTTEGLFLKVLHGCLNISSRHASCLPKWTIWNLLWCPLLGPPPMPSAQLLGKPKPPSLLLTLIGQCQDTWYWACSRWYKIKEARSKSLGISLMRRFINFRAKILWLILWLLRDF